MSLQEHNEWIRGLSYIPFKGRVNLKNPDINFWLMETNDSATNNGLIPTYQLKSRSYLGPAAMDAEMAFLMAANQAKAASGKLVYDPFVGTGSILVSAARFGAITMINLCDDKLLEFIQGADIDIQVVRDGRGPDCNVWSNFKQILGLRYSRVLLTMVKTSPYTEEFVLAAWVKHLEFKENHAKWLEDGNNLHSSVFSPAEVVVESDKFLLLLILDGGKAQIQSRRTNVYYLVLRFTNVIIQTRPIGFSAYSKSKSERQMKEMASHLLVTDFTLPLKSYKLSHLRQQRKGRSNGSQNVPTTVAYYGLKTPPYSLDGLEPFMSKRALEVHWGVHHRGFVDDLNKQLGKSDILYGYTMDELVKATYNNGNPLPEFNNAAEVWNHDFFWESMQPGGGDIPKLGLLEQIEKGFGSFTNFREKFVETALSLFGSGWVWLVLKRQEKRLAVVKTSNSINPIVWDDIPILNLDMWEHAYYLDYKNDKAKYVSTFVNHLVSWNAATVRMARAEAFVNLGEPKIPIA
ncbi:hypothetical protein V6N12_006981 [Hibiscus sabdariffa]|uniref:superoxide dismutase n=1 Tax=Hibiscus sabdariffa TaxID=183260 RepID=A0ABR2F0G5_9ROSI